MASITTWTRLEPRPRDPSLRESVQARIGDPLWLLARQWQLAEFRGENAGTPVKVDLVFQTKSIDHFAPRGKLAIPCDPLERPLEAQVEAEPVLPAELDGRRRARAGLNFLDRLSPASRAKYASAFLAKGLALEAPATPLDPGSQAFYNVMAGRTPDGVKLRARLPDEPATPLDWQNAPPALDIDPADQGTVGAALQDWAKWYDSQFKSSFVSSWDPSRLEYRFSVSAPVTDDAGAASTLTLSAAEYPGGRLEWHAFDAAARAATKKLGPSRSIVSRPTGVQFPGMPAARFWAFEPGVIDFGALETARTDLARLLFAEFALNYGNDFFLIPLELGIGSLTRIESLTVTDSFGQIHSIESTGQVDQQINGSDGRAPWRMFALSSEVADAKAEDLLFLVPSLVGELHGRALEEVTFLRDEMANCVWAIESRVTGPNGQTYERAEAFQAERQRALDEAGAAGPDSGPLTYRLFTSVPDFWNPMLPRRSSSTGPVGLRLREIGSIAGVILADYQAGASINEEEMPRSGLSIWREPQMARWIGGGTFAWIGRHKRPGPGEGASGLQFDVLEPANGSEPD